MKSRRILFMEEYQEIHDLIADSYPCFFSCRFLNKRDSRLVRQYASPRNGTETRSEDVSFTRCFTTRMMNEPVRVGP